MTEPQPICDWQTDPDGHRSKRVKSGREGNFRARMVLISLVMLSDPTVLGAARKAVPLTQPQPICHWQKRPRPSYWPLHKSYVQAARTSVRSTPVQRARCTERPGVHLRCAPSPPPTRAVRPAEVVVGGQGGTPATNNRGVSGTRAEIEAAASSSAQPTRPNLSSRRSPGRLGPSRGQHVPCQNGCGWTPDKIPCRWVRVAGGLSHTQPSGRAPLTRYHVR